MAIPELVVPKSIPAIMVGFTSLSPAGMQTVKSIILRGVRQIVGDWRLLDFIQMVDKKKRQDKLISLSKEKSYAYLATRDYDRIDPLCASFQGAHLGPGAGTGDGRDSGAGQTNGDVRLAR